jgi:hypothetical protein
MQQLEKANFEDLIVDPKIPIRLAFIKPDGTPNVISLWYKQVGEKILSYLTDNPKCGFEIAADKPPYKGVRGTGSAIIIQDKGQEILKMVMSKYLGDKESTLSKFLEKNSSSEVAIEITPAKLFVYDYTKRMKDI